MTLKNSDRNIRSQIAICLTLFITLLSFNCQPKNKSESRRPVRIAAAANLQFVLPTLDSLFHAQTGVELSITYGASGLLAAQIEQGAPFDLFLAANEAYPKHLWEKGFSVDPPRTYALGYLIWWWKKEDQSFENRLKTARKIVIANPKTAPYGVEAVRYLKKMNLLELVKDHLVYGENIGQVNQFLVTGAADLGLTAKSALGASQMQTAGRWEAVDPTLYDPIRQALILTPTADTQAFQFVNFLFHSGTVSQWEKFGYSRPQE